MLGFIKRLFVRLRPSAPGYDAARKIAAEGDEKARLALARDPGTHQEILYYLAQHDPDPRVRRAVAGNASTPVQAAPLLVADRDADVRLILAERLVRLLPGLGRDRQSQLYAFAVQALGTLALDEVLKIRLALSSALKDKGYAPPIVVGQLARDIVREVSEPVLRFCAALSDEDLLDILKSHPAPWAVQAIAGRDRVSGLVARAVIDIDDRPAGVVLLGNEGAEIGGELLAEIVEKARHYPEWQKPVAVRRDLPPEVAKALAAFADASVRDVLERREDFDPVTIAEVSKAFRRRLEFAGAEEAKTLTPAQRVVRLEKEGRLTEETIVDALAMRDRDLVYAILARRARVPAADVERVFALKTPKPIVALCWRAGLSMRMAFAVQKDLGHIQPRDLVYPRDGTDFPFTGEEMDWQLEFLGLKPG